MPDAHHLGCAGSADLGHDAVDIREGREATHTVHALRVTLHDTDVDAFEQPVQLLMRHRPGNVVMSPQVV